MAGLTREQRAERAALSAAPAAGHGDYIDGQEAATVTDIASNPEFKDAVARAVAETLTAMGAPTAQSAPNDWADFMQSMKQLASAMQEQRPGYSKPLPPEELQAREEGRIEFFGLIDDAQDSVENFGRKGAREKGLVPQYTVGPNGFYMRTENGEELFSPGQPLYLTVAPPIDFEPLNEPAAKIMRAQMQWLGEEPGNVADMVAAAQMRALGKDPDSEDRAVSRRVRQMAEVDADGPIAMVGPRRVMGATVEQQGDDGHTQFRVTKGHVARPVSGPVFV